MRYIVFVASLLLCASTSFSQSVGNAPQSALKDARITPRGPLPSLKGKIIDRSTKEPLEMVVLTDSATARNTMTDKAGNFQLKGLSSGLSTIIVSMIGYKSQRITVHAGKIAMLNIGLERGPVDLKEVTITSASGGVVGAFHTLSKIDLNMQPVRSSQDLLRLVPGLFIAQHQGGGKAEQIFLRGFDADHGTDVNISVDGMPVNMVSHAHGQGYADLHFLIPETISGYDFGKGVYYADKGDFTTAGYVAYHTLNVLNHDMLKVEGGQYNNIRLVGLFNLLSPKALEKGQSAYIAAEGLYFDGPFHYPEHFNRGNLFGKFVTPLGHAGKAGGPGEPDGASKLTVELSTLSSPWRASGELPNRSVAEGYIKDRFGVIDSAQGGNTTRTNAIVKVETRLNDHLTMENMGWYSYYFFNLISNFTFYYYYPQTGDEFRQNEHRNQLGYNGKLTDKAYFGNVTLTSTAGWGLRDDRVTPGFVAHTLEGDTILNYIQRGDTRELNVNAYLDETLHAGNWLFNAGIRADYLHFYYDNLAPASDTSANMFLGKNPRAGKAIFCPKLNVQYTVDRQLQFYVKLGKGFHSNDSRIVIANQGNQTLPGAYGADLGVNWKPLPRLFINTALWYLYLQQEFTFGQDLGDQEGVPGGRTKREGIDFSARYQLTDWLFANLNVDLAHPRRLDQPKGQEYIALAPTLTSTAGLDFRFPSGWNGGISYRYLHRRPADVSNTLPALGYFIMDMTVNYTKKNYEIGLAVENLLDQTWNESQFEYTSRLKYETAPVTEVSYTPGTPFFAKLKFVVFF